VHLSTVETALEYQVREPTHFCFNVEAARWPTQKIVSERLAVSSGVAPRHFLDPVSGNRFFRFDALPGPLLVNYQAEVEVYNEAIDDDLPEARVGEVPDAIFHHLMPSRYCGSDVMAGVARDLFGALPPGLRRVRGIVDWIHQHIAYQPGSTDSTTTAQQVLAQRAGVCRDFAHLGISFCRALNIPARLVAGYVWFDEPPQDFHAVFEAWLGDRWVMFDPTGMAPVDRLVRIGTGRDAKDVAFSTIFGAVEMTRMEISVLEHDPRRGASSGPAALQLAASGV
jgi:transglutaminase-like putative cysteine protease